MQEGALRGPNRIERGGDDSLRRLPANVSVDAYRLPAGNNEPLAWQDDIPDLTWQLFKGSRARIWRKGC